ncbi:MAG: hypothetical protein ACK6D4_09355 [Planctomyces sp.]
MPLLVRINDNDVLLYEGQLQGPLEFGRQQQGEQGPGSVSSAAGVTRIVMASLDNKKIARRQLQARILLSRAAEKNLGPEFVRRRLCRVRVVNMLEPVELFELNDAGSRELNQRYEQALLLFEQGDLKKAARQLGEILEAWPDDGPTLVLLSRVVSAMLEGGEHLDTVWNLSRK